MWDCNPSKAAVEVQQNIYTHVGLPFGATFNLLRFSVLVLDGKTPSNGQVEKKINRCLSICTSYLCELRVAKRSVLCILRNKFEVLLQHEPCVRVIVKVMQHRLITDR